MKRRAASPPVVQQSAPKQQKVASKQQKVASKQQKVASSPQDVLCSATAPTPTPARIVESKACVKRGFSPVPLESICKKTAADEKAEQATLKHGELMRNVVAKRDALARKLLELDARSTASASSRDSMLSMLKAWFAACSHRRDALLDGCRMEAKTAEDELATHEHWMTESKMLRFNSCTQECKICRDDIAPGRAVVLGCSHGFYCSQCVTRYVEARLSEGIAGDVPCPDCALAVPQKDLVKILPQKTILCLHARSVEQKAVASGAMMRSCPTPNCTMRQVLKEGSTGCDVCTKCFKESCWLCGAQPFHEGRTCQQHANRKRVFGQSRDEALLYEWMDATGTRQCPKCQMAVSKENIHRQTEQRAECHKMLCRNCGTKFCFKCLAVLTATFTCKCSKSKHGFIDPHTGERLDHLKRGAANKAAAGC